MSDNNPTLAVMRARIHELVKERDEFIEALRDISRQPEGDEQSAQAVAREVLAKHQWLSTRAEQQAYLAAWKANLDADQQALEFARAEYQNCLNQFNRGE